jgi:NAD(P)-dependent dehydrogenase (short-subunit alcohol dehydrogenase family)
VNRGRLTGKVAIVTGAGSGIGRATALRFAAEGAAVVVNDIAADAAEATARAITEAGGASVAHAGDIGDSAYVDSLVSAAVERHGHLDVMHNNAGYGRPGELADCTDETFDEMLRVNLSGTMYGTRAALRVMKQQRGGSIVNTASVAGLAHSADRGSYGTAKAGVIHLTKVTAWENGRFGIRCNAICPGPVETPAFRRFAPDLDFYASQIPMRRLGTPDDVAALALFLASDESSYISGVAIPIDGGMTTRLPAPFLRPEDVRGAP